MIAKHIILLSTLLLVIPSTLRGVSTQNLGINEKTTVLCFPITGANNPVVINHSGSYRLATNLVNNQIIIDADDVCLLLTGQSVINNNTDAIVVKDGHSDIIIQGGEVSCDGPTGSNTCIKIGDNLGNCYNILIQNMKLSWAAYGIYSNGPIGGQGNVNLLFKDMTIFDCNRGIYADHNKNLRIRQVYLGSVYDEGVHSYDTGILLDNTSTYTAAFSDTTIEDCTISAYANAIGMYAQSNNKINRCTIMDIYSLSTFGNQPAYGIVSLLGYNNIISNCSITNINAIWYPVFFSHSKGISLIQEDASQIVGCTVHSMEVKGYPTVGQQLSLIGIDLFACGENASAFKPCSTPCIIAHNTVSNICTSTGTPTHGVVTAVGFRDEPIIPLAPTPNIYIGNFAINASGFSSNIPWVRSAANTYGPPNQFTPYSCGGTNQAVCPDSFPWNWVLP